MSLTVLFLGVFAAFPAAIGYLTIISWLRSSEAPMDSSNRINRIILWWLVLTKPHLFVGDNALFRMDVEDQVRVIGKIDNE